MKEDIRNIKNVRTWIILMFIFIALLLFYTWCRVQCVQVGYEISKAANTYQKRVTRHNNLEIEHARLKSPERIARIAKDKLGLIMPTAKQMIIIP